MIDHTGKMQSSLSSGFKHSQPFSRNTPIRESVSEAGASKNKVMNLYSTLNSTAGNPVLHAGNLNIMNSTNINRHSSSRYKYNKESSLVKSNNYKESLLSSNKDQGYVQESAEDYLKKFSNYKSTHNNSSSLRTSSVGAKSSKKFEHSKIEYLNQLHNNHQTGLSNVGIGKFGGSNFSSDRSYHPHNQVSSTAKNLIASKNSSYNYMKNSSSLNNNLSKVSQSQALGHVSGKKALDLYYLKESMSKHQENSVHNHNLNITRDNNVSMKKNRNDNLAGLRSKESTLKNDVKQQQKELAGIESSIKEKKDNLNRLRVNMNKKLQELDGKRFDLEENFWKKKEMLEQQLEDLKYSNEESFKKLKQNIEGIHKRNVETSSYSYRDKFPVEKQNLYEKDHYANTDAVKNNYISNSDENLNAERSNVELFKGETYPEVKERSLNYGNTGPLKHEKLNQSVHQHDSYEVPEREYVFQDKYASLN